MANIHYLITTQYKTKKGMREQRYRMFGMMTYSLADMEAVYCDVAALNVSLIHLYDASAVGDTMIAELGLINRVRKVYDTSIHSFIQ
jgi:hypothetical protein